MKSRLKWVWRSGIGIAGCLVGGWLLLGWWSASEIVSPSRRTLQDYHEEFLRNPEAHGMMVERFSLADGTPCLLCSPSPSGSLGERGRKVLGDLARLGVKSIEKGALRGTLVLLHGRKGRKEDNLPVAERFCAAGFRCVLVDLPAHGDHPGKRGSYGPREAGLPAAALEGAARRFGFEARPRGLWGISMGGSVAVHACAAEAGAWDALVVVGTFDRLEPVIARQADEVAGPWLGALLFQGTRAWYGPLSGGGRLEDVMPVAEARGVSVPALVAHGTDDPLIPTEAARRLFDAFSGEKKWVDVGGGTHGNVLITEYPLYAEMAAWFIGAIGEE